MAIIPFDRFDVIRRQLDWADGFRYDLQFYGNRTNGYVEVFTDKVAELKHEGFYETILNAGINEDENYAHIMQFWPNGKIDEWESNCRKGIGSKMLELIIKDFTEEGAKLLFGRTFTKSMRNFFKKKNFVCSEDKNSYYKLL
ncbi:MAG: hypothetical protein ABIB71_01265 [Candidatus Woesearchaeota archaeon]